MVESPPTAFGDLLRRFRLSAGMTQQDLAERAGLSVHGIQKLERGATHPYRDTAQRLIQALRLEADDKVRLQAAAAPVRRHHPATSSTGSEGAAHNNLPVPMTSLIGRELATREVVRLLADTRLLTLTGVGGCGKTRLALEVARAVRDDFAHGAWLVELGPVVDPAFVAARVAAVLGVRETAELPLATALVRALRDRTLLLVLDNCEHLLDACAHLLDTLLQACPGVHVLATSREAIGISGEVAWRVPSLALPAPTPVPTPEQLLPNPAMQLFLQRAMAVQPRFALTSRNASAVTQICRRLDGIPLALELAAARVGALSAEQIAQRLDQRFRLLTGGSRAALPRQQTLAATLDWSYDLLGKAERMLFERLAVFSGGWTLEAAEATCGDAELDREDVLDLLAHLTRKSLVGADELIDGSARYSLLETVKDYARQKLAARGAAGITALRDRHAAFYGAWVEQLVPNPRAQWSVAATLGPTIAALSRVEPELDNIRAMLNWCLDSGRATPGIQLAIRLFFFWEVRGLYAEARRWLGALLELAERTAGGSRVDSITLEDRATALFIIGSYALRRGDYAETRARHDEAIALWRDVGDDLAVAAVLAERGLVGWLLGDAAEAIDYLEESRRVFQREDRSVSAVAAHAVNALRALGMVARGQGDYTRAAECFRESIGMRLDGAGGGYNAARGLCHLGRTVSLQGDVVQAKQIFHEALGIMLTDRLAGHSLADCLDWLAAVADADGRPHEAAVLFGAAEAQWQASGGIRYAPERAAYAADLARVRSKLRADELDAAWAEGYAMSRERAVSYALEQTRRTDAG